MSENVKEKGYLGENEFIKLLNIHGVPFDYIDAWVDFTIYDLPVEVKSCQLSHKFTNKNSKTQSYKIGRFDFTELQREHEIHVAFFVRVDDRFLFLGIGKLSKNSPRYISIHKTRELDLMGLDEFIKKIKGA